MARGQSPRQRARAAVANAVALHARARALARWPSATGAGAAARGGLEGARDSARSGFSGRLAHGVPCTVRPPYPEQQVREGAGGAAELQRLGQPRSAAVCVMAQDGRGEHAGRRAGWLAGTSARAHTHRRCRGNASPAAARAAGSSPAAPPAPPRHRPPDPGPRPRRAGCRPPAWPPPPASPPPAPAAPRPPASPPVSPPPRPPRPGQPPLSPRVALAGARAPSGPGWRPGRRRQPPTRSWAGPPSRGAQGGGGGGHAAYEACQVAARLARRGRRRRRRRGGIHPRPRGAAAAGAAVPRTALAGSQADRACRVGSYTGPAFLTANGRRPGPALPARDR